MLQQDKGSQDARRSRLVFQYGRSEADRRAAQQLRWRVFSEEMGARLSGTEPGLDQDRFDDLCDHLLVRDTRTSDVVGTYRIINSAQARLAGGFYSDGEFDLSRLDHLRDRVMEVGRACVHPDYRSGAVIAALWSGLADYIQRHDVQYLMGCASISMADGGYAAASIFRQLHAAHAAPPEWRVFPHCPLPLDRLEADVVAEVPPLIKAYLRVGAYVCGDPAWDPDFNTADCLLLLPTAQMDHRYSRHFLQQSLTEKLF